VKTWIQAGIIMIMGGLCMAADDKPAENSRPLRLLIFGASTSAYRGSLEIASFQVSDRLRTRGIDHVFFNSGVGGNTTAMARQRFERDVLGLYPDIVFILIGTNDSMIDVWDGKTDPRVSEADYAENLRFFARELKQRDITAVFMTIQPLYMTDTLRKLYDKPPYTEKGFNFMVDRYVAAMKKVAEEEGIPCLDINKKFWQTVGGDYDKLPSLYLDGMHPNRQGQALIAREMLDLLDKTPGLLQKRSAHGNQAAPLAVDLPAARGTYPAGRLAFTLSTPRAPAKLQYRWRPYAGQPKTFGEWVDARFAFDAGHVKGAIEGLAANTCSFQFRTLDEHGRTSAVGAVDHVMIKEP
jgi:lysophospholipase L1-like esterase